jgi:glycerol-3-phosphate dehydrogenase subunit C
VARRPGAALAAEPMNTILDWSAYADAGLGDAYADIPRHGGNFAKAVASCINSRRCEATDAKAVMCPSYRVSLEPALSTGGRVRLLKAALNAELPEAALAAPDLARAMDLCVGCKGCQRECENNVDMALIKTEYLAQRAAQHGHGLRARLFAGLPRWLHRHRGLTRRLIAARNRHGWLARLGQRLFGIAAGVPLPEPTPTPFHAPSTTTPVAPAEAGRPEIVLLVDCFGRHFEPEIPRAMTAVLAAAGYRVLVAEPAADDAEPRRPLCCGRTYLAQGMVEQAAAEARRLLAALLPHARAGRWIIGAEPSCLLGLRDEYRALGLGDAAREVADKALLLEEFLARESMAKRLDLPLGAPAAAGRVLVHGHCHQKAVGGMKPLRKVLKLVPGLDFALLDAGCCGMAGTFGLEREHAELSSRMAALELLPQLAAQPDARVIANGFSCRAQIRAHSAQQPRHLAQLLADALGTPAGRSATDG